MVYRGPEPRMEYPQDARFVCGVCGRGFDSEEAVWRHRKDTGQLW